jgi:hypothetical protein
MRKLITLGFTAALLAGLMLVPGAASARKHTCPSSARVDRNRDGLPDRWECRNGLSLRVKQARRDADRDGLNNRGEFRAGTNPRDADTDNDGVRDGAENPGTIASFDAQTGTLVINLAGGGTVSGRVTSATEIECKGAARTARTARDDGDNSGPGSSSSGSGRGGDDRGDDRGRENEAGENEQENEDNCSTTALQAGRTVREAELVVTSTGNVFRKIEVVV